MKRLRCAVAIPAALILGCVLASPAAAEGLGQDEINHQLMRVAAEYGYGSATEAGLNNEQLESATTAHSIGSTVDQRASVPVGPHSEVLGTAGGLGSFAPPIERFRDGGHAYYLFGGGLHSCTYIGKCMDLFAEVGEPVYAMADGVVKIPPYAAHSYGNYVVIKHRDGTESISAHLDTITVKPGPVSAGTQIGTVGCSGTSGEYNKCANFDEHLHLEWSGLHWNPGDYGEAMPYFDEWRGHPMRCFKGC